MYQCPYALHNHNLTSGYSYLNLNEDIFSRALTEALADRIFIVNNEGVIEDFKINTDYHTDDNADYKGKRLSEIFPDDPGFSESALPLIRKAINEKRNEVFRFISPQPLKLQFNEVRYAYLDDARILVLHKNMEPLVSISGQLFKNQALLKALIENNDDAIFALDSDYRYILFNEMHKRNMKVKYGHDIEMGKSILDYIKINEDLGIGKQVFGTAFAGESHTFESDFGDEGLFRGHVLMHVFPLRNDIGKILGVAVFAKDRTLQKQVQTQKDHYLSTMERMVSDLSHKLRKPVATILGLVQLIDEEKNITDLHKIMEYLKESTAEMDECIKQMTTFIESSRNDYK
jgi:PAS domain-containing protein